MKALLRSLLFAGTQYAVAEAFLRGESAKRRLGSVLRGVILLVIAGILACFAGVFLLASLFFSLADMAEFIKPALITALVAAAIVIGLVWEGWRQLRK